jgi:putative transposase
MGTSAFQQGHSVEIDDKPYTLLRKVTAELWQLEEVRTKRIHEYTHEQLQGLYAQGKLVFINSSLVHELPSERKSGKSYRDISDKDFDAAKLRRSYVNAVLDLPANQANVAPFIHAHWLKLKAPEVAPNPSTVLRWKAKYLAGGKDITVLVDASDRKGNHNPRYPKEVDDIVDEAVEHVYMTLERQTVQDTLDNAKARVSKENKLRPEAEQLPSPTRRLVQRAINAISAFDRYVARYGHTAAVRRFRSVLGHRTTLIPLERAEIDHTPMDLLVVDDDTWVPLGRPYLTSCIDDFTRCILGIHIGFDPPSYLSVARCLKDAFLPKVGLKEKYPEILNDWIAHGVMRELVVDNGAEFHSKSLEAACYSLGIEIHYAPRKTGWFKGKIERWQGTLNRAISHGTPGTSTLQKIVRMWIADYYHQKPHRSLKVPPAELWASNIRPEDILVPDDPARLDAILGRIEERRLTHKGIELDCLYYNSVELAELRKRLGDTLDVEVRINDADIGAIIVFSPDKKQMFEVPALRKDYAKGTSRWQHRIYKQFASKHMGAYDPTSWLEAKQTIARLVQEDLMQKPKKTRAKVARFKENQSGNVAKENPSTPAVNGAVGCNSHTNSDRPQKCDNVTAIDSTDKQTVPRKQFKPIYRERIPNQIQNN